MVSALLSSVFVYGGYTIYANDGLEGIYEPGLHHLEVFSIYHGKMNDLFNERITMLLELTESEDFFSDPAKQKRLVIPNNVDRENDSVAEIVAKCRGVEESEVNLSSYCLSMEGLQFYKEYVLRLNEMQTEVDFSNYDGSINSTLFDTSAKNAAIEDEIMNARNTLEAAVGAYQEFMQAYPMHMKYQEVIKKLLKYKLELKDVRNETALFPFKFIDATSLYCE